MSVTIPPVEAKRPLVPEGRVSFEEFLAWADEEVRAEWVDGEVLLMSPASADHQRLRDFLLTLIRLFVEAHCLGEVLSAPFLMRTPSRPSGREPDLLFVANEHADRVRATYLDGAADLVVEIVSPESDERDRGEKFVEYEGAGIPEYWLVDPLRQETAFYRLGEDRRYHPVPLDPSGFYRSAMLAGFRLRAAWLWERPLPAIRDVLPETEA